jgi:hypothetical protein
MKESEDLKKKKNYKPWKWKWSYNLIGTCIDKMKKITKNMDWADKNILETKSSKEQAKLNVINV